MGIGVGVGVRNGRSTSRSRSEYITVVGVGGSSNRMAARSPTVIRQALAVILFIEEILHQLIDSLSHYLQGFVHPRWCRISAISSSSTVRSNGNSRAGPLVAGAVLTSHSIRRLRPEARRARGEGGGGGGEEEARGATSFKV